MNLSDTMSSVASTLLDLVSTSDTNLYDNYTLNATTTHCAGVTMEELLPIYRQSAARIDKYFTPIWYVIGFPGNLLAFLIWIQPKMRPSSGCYLAALAMNDFIFLALHTNYELYSAWNVKVLDVPVWCELFPILFFTAQYLAPLFVLGFTVERYISICHPYKRDKYCTTKRAIVVIVSLVIFSLFMHSIQGYFWSYSDNECSPRKEVMENDSTSLFTIWSWVTELLTFAVVPVAILVLNVLVIIETRRISKRQSEYTIQGNSTHNKSSSQSATTIMLLAVSFYLIISTLPVTVFYAIVHTFPNGDPCLTVAQVEFDPVWQKSLTYWNCRKLIEELGMSHYACNFYIYLLTGKQFRTELRILFTRIFCKKSIRRLLGMKDDSFSTQHHRYEATEARTLSTTEIIPLK